MITKSNLNNYLKNYNIKATSADIEKIFLYTDLIFKNNLKFNITGTREKDEILKRHILDSLSFFIFFNKYKYSFEDRKKFIDIGTGGGLPGLAIAVFLKNCIFYLLDCKKKMTDFLETVISELDLKNIKVVPGRAEVLAHDPDLREKFDIVLSRALGSISIVSELILPFCAVGGHVVIYKSRKVFDEISLAGRAVYILGGKISEIMEVKVPDMDEYRALLVLKKESHTLYNYPRKYAKIIKKPGHLLQQG